MENPVAVTIAGPDRRSVLAPILGRAFVDEPMMRWPMGADGDAVDRFTRAFDLFLEGALPMGVVWEVGPAAGAAVWIPPGKLGQSTGHPWFHAGILALTDDGGARYEAFWTWVDARTPEEPRWQLDTVAVHPRLQGRGYGRALIEAGQTRATSDGVGAWLSTGTPHNVGIYQRCGFEVAAELPAPDGGPTIWFMRWDP